MDEKIHQMISEYVESSKAIIECKSEIGKKSDVTLINIFDHSFQSIPGHHLDLDIGIVSNIGTIIKLKRDMERIGIGEQGDSDNQSDGEEMSKGRRGLGVLNLGHRTPSPNFGRRIGIIPYWKRYSH